MPRHFIQHIQENLPDVEFVDCDELYDNDYPQYFSENPVIGNA